MNQTKITIQRGFNDLFFRFLDELLPMFPQTNKFAVAKTTFELMKRGNPSALVKGWYSFITSYFVMHNEPYNFERFLELYAGSVPENNIKEIIDFLDCLVAEINGMKKTGDLEKYKIVETYFLNLNKLAHTYMMNC